MEHMIEVRGVTHRYSVVARGGEFEVLKDIDVTIPENRFVSLIGASGCGKSTLLRIMAGLVIPTEGSVLAMGEPVKGPEAKRGMVFQQDAVFPWLTVRQNVEYGPRVRGVKRDERHALADRWIRMVGLEGWEEAYPKELSGGMRKRVDLARVYANGPKIMLMDEPFGALDAQTKSQMQTHLLQLWEQVRSTVVFVTHDLEEAVYLSDEVIIITPRPGRIHTTMPVDLQRPRNEELRLSEEFLVAKRHLYDQLKECER